MTACSPLRRKAPWRYAHHRPPDSSSVPASISDQLEGKSWTTRTRRLGVIRAEQRLSVDIVGIEERDTEVFNPKHWKVYDENGRQTVCRHWVRFGSGTEARAWRFRHH